MATTLPPAPAASPRLDALLRCYLNAQMAGDRREALRLVVEDGIEAGISARDLLLGVVQPAQYEVGRLWQQNVISVAQEHLATAISQFVLSNLYTHLPREASNGRRVVLACVQGEHHEMGARVAADFLEMAGFDVQYLGANVPTADLVKLVVANPPAFVALSATMPANLAAMQDAVRRLCEATDNRVPVAVGGTALAAAPDADWQRGTLVSCADVDRLIDAARGLPSAA